MAQLNVVVLTRRLVKVYCPFDTGHGGLVTHELAIEDGNYLLPPPSSLDSLHASGPVGAHPGQAGITAALLTQLDPALNSKSY